MSVDGGVSRCSSEVLVFSVRNMLVSLGITVSFCKSEINNVDLISFLSKSHQEVVGFDVTMNDSAVVRVSHGAAHALHDGQHMLQRDGRRLPAVTLVLRGSISWEYWP